MTMLERSSICEGYRQYDTRHLDIP